MLQVQEVRESKGVAVALDALRRLGGWQRTTAVAKACGLTHDWALQMLHEAVGVGKAEMRRPSHSVYEWRALSREAEE